MPYLIEGPPADSSVRLLLVTTRGSRGRWVIPKGNPGSGAPHVSAAKEAEEEAGVRGSVCPHAIGSYRYRKRQPSGAAILLDVDVFPLAVTDELASWKEQGEREHDADEISRTVLQSVRKTFLTPFDRGAIAALIGSMDDTVDEMQATASAIELYEVETIPQEMKDMVAIIVDAARVTAEAIPLLRDLGRNAGRLHELTERLVRMESHADAIHAAGLKKALHEHGATNTLQFVVDREVYKHLERITDAFEDVADQIDGIVIEHA